MTATDPHDEQFDAGDPFPPGDADADVPGTGFGLERGVRVFGRDELRAIDAEAVETYGVPSMSLMEHAATQLTEASARLLSVFDGDRALVVCGPGNNGGDGLATARHLDALGYDVRVVLAGARDGYTGDAGAQLRICERAGIRVLTPAAGEAELDAAVFDAFGGDVSSGGTSVSGSADGAPDLVIDAVFGTGFDGSTGREPEGVARGLIERINELGAGGVAVVAADVPSGLDADTGAAPGACVDADLTVTFAGLKRGFLTLGAQAFLGEVVVAPIGAPRALLERYGEPAEPGWAERFGREQDELDGAPPPAPTGNARGAGG
jgi:hydroxyethylthiazole kinase-like uncharacterized protein yjeF